MAVFEKQDFFCGFITYGDRIYVYKVHSPHTTSDKYKFEIDWRLQVILQHSLDEFLHNCNFNNPEEFHTQFTSFVDTQLELKNKPKSYMQNPLKICSFLKNLKKELQTCEEFIKNLDLETGVVEIEIVDSQLRAHKAVLKLSQNYPREVIEVVSHNLPLHRIDLAENDTDLNNLYTMTEFCKKFSQLVDNFQEFWNVMSTIDSQSVVLDPANPTFKDVMRRIKLSDTLSVALTFNPYNPRQRPNIKLLGCQSDVSKCEAVMMKNLEEDLWDADEDVLYNLSNLLELNISNKIYVDESADIFNEKNEGECAICFMWRLDDEIPSEVCETTTCKSMYHSKCLFTYLSSVPRNRDYFGKIQGECPNCDEIISCTVPKLK